MSTFIIPLFDIITDPSNPIDLEALPEEEAQEIVRELYGFLSPLVEVAVHAGMAVITLPEENERKAERALGQIKDASRAGASGNYAQAIRLYELALNVMPAHTEARRELAMAQLESGKATAAKSNLIRVLQLDPKDAWAYLILGNLYFKVEKDLGSAERYYALAVDLASEDPYILNSYASLLAERGKSEEAQAMWQRATNIAPDYPNPRLGMATLLGKQGNTAEAFRTLEALLALPAAKDARSATVFESARRLYTDLRVRQAAATSDDTMTQLQAVMDAYTAATGIDVRLRTDPKLETDAKVELAWRYGRDYHQISYRSAGGIAVAHRIAHEFEHVLLEQAARDAGSNRLFATTDATESHAYRTIERDMRKLRSRLGDETAQQYAQMVVGGLANQLYNMPVDLFIETRLHVNYPWLHDAQFAGLAQQLADNEKTVTDKQVRELAPPSILQANLAMNAALALFVDELFGGITAYAAAYEAAGALRKGRALYRMAQPALEKWTPGSEYDLVDRWASELGLTEWYSWVPDNTGPASSDPAAARPGRDLTVTNPDLLAEPAAQMAATMYMVGALKQFAHMDRPVILRFVTEIAQLGQQGLDYTDSDTKYTLDTAPGKSFTGLQLMSWMYVGFKIIEPDLDTGIPFEDAYRSALTFYEQGL